MLYPLLYAPLAPEARDDNTADTVLVATACVGCSPFCTPSFALSPSFCPEFLAFPAPLSNALTIDFTALFALLPSASRPSFTMLTESFMLVMDFCAVFAFLAMDFMLEFTANSAAAITSVPALPASIAALNNSNPVVSTRQLAPAANAPAENTNNADPRAKTIDAPLDPLDVKAGNASTNILNAATAAIADAENAIIATDRTRTPAHNTASDAPSAKSETDTCNPCSEITGNNVDNSDKPA